MASKVELPSHFRDWNGSSDPSVEAPEKTSAQKPIWKRPLFITFAVAAAIAIIIAIVVPLAVILPKKGKSKHNATVMLPLYIYPQENATWAPLYDALQSKPGLNFTVIINPSSGPGSSPFPDEQYTTALTQLATYPNARKVGYVRTGYATRNLSDVISELNVYAGWASKNQAFAIDGIFFDESPHQYSQNAVDFMLNATRAVKNANFQGLKTVIRNPGVVPAQQFADANTDISVDFEQSYTEYGAKEAELSALKDNRSGKCYMVHSLPTMDKAKLDDFVDGLSKSAEYLFVTTNAENYYESFGQDWADFTAAIPA
ncbi:Spherulation-specific family 4-domain-containing protein [Paraphoma chrysanthemicola]|nr:Spherulation-specific family 4-domain-containing protein [Paraphoma chrysanthemicola]